jgi:hypothetical protein
MPHRSSWKHASAQAAGIKEAHALTKGDVVFFECPWRAESLQKITRRTASISEFRLLLDRSPTLCQLAKRVPGYEAFFDHTVILSSHAAAGRGAL